MDVEGQELTREDMGVLLSPTGLLSDRVLNAFLAGLQNQLNDPTLWIQSTFFMALLVSAMADRTEARLVRWFRRLQQLDRIRRFLFPVHHADECHWSLLVVSVVAPPGRSLIEHYDSLGVSEQRQGLEERLAIFLDHLYSARQLPLPAWYIATENTWRPSHLCRQSNLTDCGVYMAYYAYAVAIGETHLLFLSLNAREWRLRICQFLLALA